MKTKFNPLFPVLAASAISLGSAHGATVLASDFTGVSKSGNTADSFSWDTVNGINTPSTSLDFFDADDGTTAVSFHDVTANEIVVNQNMTAGGWVTSFNLSLNGSTASISLTNLIVDLRLATGSGGDNTTGSKQGQISLEVIGSTSGSLGTADLGGDQAYPTVEYTRTLDLSGFADLNSSETYTFQLSATGSGFGHHKSMQAVELTGDISPIPEPSVALLGGLGLLALLRRRR